MTEHLPSLLELQRTDELLDEIAARRTPSADDRALGMLASLAEAVDAHPFPALPEQSTVAVTAPMPSRRRTRTPARQLAGALAIVLTLSSSGIAAAVTGDPLLPIKTVVRHFYAMSHDPNGPESPWILGGSDKARGGGPADTSTPPPALAQPQRFGDDSPSVERIRRDAPRPAVPMTAGERAPADQGAVVPPTPADEPSSQESSTSTPADGQPADDGARVSGDDSQGQDTSGGSSDDQGEDGGTTVPDPAGGDPDTDGGYTPPTPATCTDPDPSHPENPPITPCPPTENPADPPADPPPDNPADKPLDNPTDDPTDHPADEPTENPTDNAADESGGTDGGITSPQQQPTPTS